MVTCTYQLYKADGKTAVKSAVLFLADPNSVDLKSLPTLLKSETFMAAEAKADADAAAAAGDSQIARTGTLSIHSCQL
jgi:hypothetical protein